MKNKLILTAILTALTFAISANAQAPNTYVAGATGNDANPCTRALPCATVNQAITAVDPNGTVLIIESGTYNQPSVPKPLTIAAAEGVTATIHDNGGAVPFAIFVNIQNPGETVTIRNLNLVARDPHAIGISNFNDATMFIENCKFYGFRVGINIFSRARTYISRTTFRKNLTAMLAAGPQSTESGLGRVTIDSSVFEANEMGIHAANKILMNIRNSTFTGNSVQAIWIRSYMPNILAEVIIDNSQINHNATGVLVTGFGGIASVQLTRSTVTRNGQAGILLQGTGYAYSAGNNTFFGNNPDVSGGNLQSQPLK